MEFLERVRFFREWIEHFLPASFCGRVRGWNEPLQEAESERKNGDLILRQLNVLRSPGGSSARADSGTNRDIFVRFKI